MGLKILSSDNPLNFRKRLIKQILQVIKAAGEKTKDEKSDMILIEK